MKAVRIHEFGGLEVLKWEEVPEPEPRANQVLIKVDSAGVNYADISRRQGNYPGPDLPSTLGLEAAGTIVEVGGSVTGLTVGQRVMAMGGTDSGPSSARVFIGPRARTHPTGCGRAPRRHGTSRRAVPTRRCT